MESFFRIDVRRLRRSFTDVPPGLITGLNGEHRVSERLELLIIHALQRAEVRWKKSERIWVRFIASAVRQRRAAAIGVRERQRYKPFVARPIRWFDRRVVGLVCDLRR